MLVGEIEWFRFKVVARGYTFLGFDFKKVTGGDS